MHELGQTIILGSGWPQHEFLKWSHRFKFVMSFMAIPQTIYGNLLKEETVLGTGLVKSLLPSAAKTMLAIFN